MTPSKEDRVKQAFAHAQADKFTTFEEFWLKYLKRNHKATISRIKSSYPQEHVIIIDLKKVTTPEVLDAVGTARMGKHIEEISDAAKTLLEELPPKVDHRYPLLSIRFINVPNVKCVGALRVKDVNVLLGLKCLVKRTTEIRPKIIEANFMCPGGHVTQVSGGYNTVHIPEKCVMTGCNSRTLSHASGRDLLINRQFAIVQEPLEELVNGAQPSSLKIELTQDLCNSLVVGDRVIINGTYRAIDKMKGVNLDSSKEVYFEANSIEVGAREFEDVQVTDEDEKEIRKITGYSDLFARVEASIAPSIVGMSLLKRSIALMLFEGVTKTMPDGVEARGTVNVLCISDPGMAKTVLLRFVAKVAPRGVFADGTSSTKAGLVASVVKDELTGQWAVEAGAYMLASGGVLCLDEIGELSKDDMKSLNEAMENGEAHITKVINTVVKTRASLLGACNPIKGRFSEFEDLPQQVHLPPSLLSRFDLIVLLRDRPEERSDRKIAQHIADSHMAAGALMAGQPVSAEISDRFIPPITPDLLRKYIAYARKINPIITPVANKVLVDYYVKIRPNTDIGNTVAVTTRQQPSVIRLAEAHARMRLSKTVEEEDANAAISLFDACLKCVATDPATGKLDVDRVSNVSSAASRNIEDALINAINYVRGAAVSAKEEAVFERMSSLGYDSQKVRHHMDRLLREGKIMAPKNGLVKVM